MGKKAVGIDFGTLSARAVVLDVDDGRLCGSCTYAYPHAVMSDCLPDKTPLPNDYALAHPQDYRDALVSAIRGAVEDAQVSADEVIGIGLDSTTYSMVPCDCDANVMCEHEEYKSEPMAYIKLWKHHAAVPQSDKFQEAHEKTGGFPAVARYGGKFNCEWALPKLLETYEKAPQFFDTTYRFCDLGEWLTWIMTGKFTSALYTAGFKTYWAEDYGKPTKEGLDYVAQGFSDKLDEKFWGEPKSHFESCGGLTSQMAKDMGLNEGTPVSAAMGDGSIPGIYFCINNPNAMAYTYGTSIAMSFLNEKVVEMDGINGVAKDGIVPGYAGYDAGQPCGGDMLDWFIHNQVPAKYVVDAYSRGLDIHEYLTKLCNKSEPYNNELTVLDWWNGNRCILNDLSLRGSIIGYSLNTRPEDVYCAMLQGIACGSRIIVENLAKNGIKFDKIILCGGIPKKNIFAVGQFANIFGHEIYISDATDITARSSAMLGAIVGGVPIKEAASNMADTDFLVVKPDMEHRQDYEKLYQRWCKYHDLLK